MEYNDIKRVIIWRYSGTWPQWIAACEAAGIAWAYHEPDGDDERDAGPARQGDVWMGCWPEGFRCVDEAIAEIKRVGGVMCGLDYPQTDELLVRLKERGHGVQRHHQAPAQ